MREGGRKRHRDLGTGANLGVELFTGLGIELLGIVEPARHALGVENDRGGDDRTGKRPPARLVAAGDRPHPALYRRALATEGRTDVLLAERQANGLGGSATGCFPTGLLPTGLLTTHGAMVRAAGAKSTVSRFGHVKDGERCS